MAKRKSQIKKKDVMPTNVRRAIVCQEITPDFVLEIYEKAKRARSEKKKQELHRAAEQLSKHIGKLLVD